MLRLALIPMLLTGCARLDVEPPVASEVPAPAPVSWNDGLETQNLQPTTGVIRGAFPVVGSFDRQVSEGSLQFTDLELYLDLHSTEPDWAMLGGWVDGSVLQFGEWTTLDPTNHAVLGCAGPAFGVMDYDELAESVRVWLDAIDTPGGPALELEVEAVFEGGWDASTVVVVPDPRFVDDNPRD